MTSPVIIRPGESLPFSFDRDGQTVSGWVCQIILKVYPGDTAVVDRVVALTGEEWSGFLTSTETATLSEGKQYTLMANLTNAATGEDDQIPKKFYVGTKWE